MIRALILGGFLSFLVGCSQKEVADTEKLAGDSVAVAEDVVENKFQSSSAI
jgi:hypothetical protein